MTIDQNGQKITMAFLLTTFGQYPIFFSPDLINTHILFLYGCATNFFLSHKKIVKAIIIKKIALSVWIILWRHNLSKASSAPTHNIHAASIRLSILRLRATQRSSVRAPWFRRLLCYLGKIALWSASKLWTSSMAVLRLSRLLVWWLL